MKITMRDIIVQHAARDRKNLWKRAKRFWQQAHCGQETDYSLNKITCEFTTGVNLILGPNGCGKTTLLQVLAGLVLPCSGTIKFEHNVVKRAGLRRLASYLPQTFGVYPNLTAGEMLNYIALLKGSKEAKTRERCIREILQKTGLVAVADRKLKTFSRGMRQKVGIAQTLVGDPPILLLDEPTASLDPEERNRLRGLLVRLGQERIIVLASSTVADVCCADQVVVLNRGQRCFMGTPSELAASAPMMREGQCDGEGTEHNDWIEKMEEGYRTVILARINQ